MKVAPDADGFVSVTFGPEGSGITFNFSPVEWNELREYFLAGEHAEADGEKFAQLQREIESLKAARDRSDRQMAEQHVAKAAADEVWQRVFHAMLSAIQAEDFS